MTSDTFDPATDGNEAPINIDFNEERKLYAVSMTFLMQAPDPVTAQLEVLKSEDIVPINISAEEVNPEQS